MPKTIDFSKAPKPAGDGAAPQKNYDPAWCVRKPYADGSNLLARLEDCTFDGCCPVCGNSVVLSLDEFCSIMADARFEGLSTGVACDKCAQKHEQEGPQ